jgi:plastocyanin
MNRRTALKSIAAFGAAMFLPLAKSANAAVTHEVLIEDFRFKPDTLTVKVGDMINFTNKDGAPHTATGRGKKWDTGTLRKNDSGVIEVTAGMQKNYYCRFHPSMIARLKIS